MVLSAATFVGFIPQAILGPFAGAFVDRHSRKKVMIGVGGKMNLPPHGKENFRHTVSSFLHSTVGTFLHWSVRSFLHGAVISFLHLKSLSPACGE
jgi:MFS family permease